MADVWYHNILAAAMSGTVDLDSDTTKVILVTDSYTPNADHTQKSDTGANELSTGSGYTAGGVAVTPTVSDVDASNSVTYDTTDPSWTASGGPIGPFRYAIWYDDTHANDLLIYLFDFGSNQTGNDGATIKVTVATGGLFSIA